MKTLCDLDHLLDTESIWILSFFRIAYNDNNDSEHMKPSDHAVAV